MVPNVDGAERHRTKTINNKRHGTQCVIEKPNKQKSAQSVQDKAITVFATLLYNSLPTFMADMRCVQKLRKLNWRSINLLNSFAMSPKRQTS